MHSPWERAIWGLMKIRDQTLARTERGGLVMNKDSSLARPTGGYLTIVAVSSCPTARYCRYYRCYWYCCGRLKLSDDHALRGTALLIYCWYFLSAGVAGSAVLLWSSQAVDDHALRLLLYCLVLLYCGCCCGRLNCPTAGYCYAVFPQKEANTPS